MTSQLFVMSRSRRHVPPAMSNSTQSRLLIQKRCFTSVLVAIVLGITSNASAAVLTFDDISGGSVLPIPNGYGGLDWDNMSYLNSSTAGTSGYRGGTVSGDYVAYNNFANVATVSDSIFDFQSAYLAAAWNNGLSVRVKGFLGAALLYDTTVGVTYSPTLGASATLFNFNYTGIDKLEFSSFGGVDADAGDSGQGLHFVMDNFTFQPIPEPSTLALVALGLAGLACTRRKRA